MLYHAGVIAAAAGDAAEACDYLRASLEANPTSTVASEATRLLESWAANRSN